MNDIRDLFPGRMRERTFQLKAKRDAGAVWHEQQFVECKQCGNLYEYLNNDRKCPKCGCEKAALVTGKEFQLKEILLYDD